MTHARDANGNVLEVGVDVNVKTSAGDRGPTVYTVSWVDPTRTVVMIRGLLLTGRLGKGRYVPASSVLRCGGH